MIQPQPLLRDKAVRINPEAVRLANALRSVPCTHSAYPAKFMVPPQTQKEMKASALRTELNDERNKSTIQERERPYPISNIRNIDHTKHDNQIAPCENSRVGSTRRGGRIRPRHYGSSLSDFSPATRTVLQDSLR